MKLTTGDSVHIVYKPDWGNRLSLAAAELKNHLAMVGISAHHSSERAVGSKNILLGEGWDAVADADVQTFNNDGVLIRTVDSETLLLSGLTIRGTLNAVYVLLEEFFGFIWFNASETHVPSQGGWDFSSLDYQYNPPFSVRSISTASAMDDAWSARRRLNLFTDRIIPEDPRLMDSYTFAGKHCHNVFKLLSLGFFGSKEDPETPYENPELIRELHRMHPEYFAMIDGHRDPYPGNIAGADQSDQVGNISLTNREVWDLLVKGGRLLLEHYPRARIISLSLRDNYNYCEEALNAPGGVSAALVRVVNYFAEGIESSHPYVRVDFLAYHGTQRPPDHGRFRSNITVRYCPIRVSQYHAFDESDHNLVGGLNYETPPSLSQPIRQIERWSQIASRVVVWYYTLSLPYFHPQPSLRGHGRTFRRLQQLWVDGLYIQDNAPMAENCFNDLRAYLLSRLLWDPNFDEVQGLRDFCDIYYGAASPYLRDFIDLLHSEDVWDWRDWITADGVSKWAGEEKEISWAWFGDESKGQFPVPHFYTLYHSRPPLKPIFFSTGWPLLKKAAHAVRHDDTVQRRLEEVWVCFYFGVISYPPDIPDLEGEAHERFAPKYAAIRDRYIGEEFHGLNKLGLSWPEPVRSMSVA